MLTKESTHMLEKTSGDVAIPYGGIKPGFLAFDPTQVMTPEDAEMVKSKKNVFMRTQPGLIPSAISGAMVGSAIPSILRAIAKRKFVDIDTSAIGAALGGIALPAMYYSFARNGVYDKPILNQAKKLIEDTRGEQIKQAAFRDELEKLGFPFMKGLTAIKSKLTNKKVVSALTPRQDAAKRLIQNAPKMSVLTAGKGYQPA